MEGDASSCDKIPHDTNLSDFDISTGNPTGEDCARCHTTKITRSSSVGAGNDKVSVNFIPALIIRAYSLFFLFFKYISNPTSFWIGSRLIARITRITSHNFLKQKHYIFYFLLTFRLGSSNDISFPVLVSTTLTSFSFS